MIKHESVKRESKTNRATGEALFRPKEEQMPNKQRCSEVPERLERSQTQLFAVNEHQPWMDIAKHLFIPPAIMQKDAPAAIRGQNLNQGGNIVRNQSRSSKSHSSTKLYEAVVTKLCQNTEEDEGFLPYEGQFKEFIDKGLDLMSVAPLERSSLRSILRMVPTCLKNLRAPLEQLLREINDEYLLAVKRASVEYMFKRSKEKEEEKASDLPPHRLELEVYPKPWRTAFLDAEGQMMDKLHAFNPVTQKTLSLWQDHYKNLRVINVEDFHNRKDPMELSVFQKVVSVHVDHVRRILHDNWLLDVQGFYYEASRKLLVPPSWERTKLQSFFNSLAVLMTSQLREFALDSLSDYTSLISPPSEGACRHPGFVLHLVLADNEIRIEPEFRLYEEAILNVFELILDSATTVLRVDTLLLHDQTDLNFERNLNPTIQSEIVQAQKEEVRKVVLTEYVKPRECIKEYDQYSMLVSGQDEKDLKAFLSQPYSFQEILAQVIHYQNLAEQIQYTSDEVVRFGMFEVHSHKLVSSLVERTRDLQQILIARILQDHQDINKKLCNEFENISEKMIIPSDMQEVMELKAYINEVETTELPLFQQRLSDSNGQLCFLMDSVSLSSSHMQLNAQTNHLFEGLPPIFVKHKHIISTTIEQYQSGLKNGASPS